MKNQISSTARATQVRLTERSATCWRVTFDHPPLNVFGPEAILQMTEIMTALEIRQAGQSRGF